MRTSDSERGFFSPHLHNLFPLTRVPQNHTRPCVFVIFCELAPTHPHLSYHVRPQFREGDPSDSETTRCTREASISRMGDGELIGSRGDSVDCWRYSGAEWSQDLFSGAGTCGRDPRCYHDCRLSSRKSDEILKVMTS